MTIGHVISLVGVLLAVGGALVGFGVLKAKIQAAAGRQELTAAISRSDDMLELMRRMIENDRASAAGKFKELYGIVQTHGERIAALETSAAAVSRDISEIKSDVKSGFRDLSNEIRALRKSRATD